MTAFQLGERVLSPPMAAGRSSPKRSLNNQFTSETGRLDIARFNVGSLHLLDVAGLPALVDRRFGRTVKTENREVAFAGHGR